MMAKVEEVNILIVDDSPELLDITSRLFRREGYKVITSTTGAGCMEKVVSDKPDMILIDIVLPDIDGRDICKKIKSEPDLSSIFIILLSSYKISSADVKKGFLMGADFYIRRPFDTVFLLASVRALSKIIVAERGLKESVLMWKTTFNGLNDAVFLLGPDGKVLQVNSNASFLLKKREDELVGSFCFNLMHQTPGHIEGCPFLRMKKSKKRETMLLPIGNKWFEVTVDPVFDRSDNLTGAVHIMSDVTDRKSAEDELKRRSADLQLELENKRKAEAALIESNKMLEISKLAMINLLEDLRVEIESRKIAQDDIRTLNTELEMRVRDRTLQLEIANKELESFAYSVSHDLRAPLRAIDGFSKYVIDDYGAKLDNEGKRLLGLIRSNTQKMDQLITDILALSRVTRAVHKEAKVEMRKVVMAMIQEIELTLGQTSGIITVQKLPDTYADPTYIKLVWLNLISNAKKFTQKEMKPEIIIDGYVAENECVYSVKDNGVGFKPEYAHKLFGVFQRLHSSDDFEGTGVGLAIVLRIVTRHGGKVWAEGEVGKGSTFYFSLPLKNK